MAKQKKEDYVYISKRWIYAFFATILLILAIAVMQKIPTPEEEFVGGVEESQRFRGIIEACNKTSLFSSATCVNQLTRTFYKYNSSNAEKQLDFEELYEQGGACGNWAEYYCSIGDLYGYHTSMPEFQTGEYNLSVNERTIRYTINHQFCIWADASEGYVILDESSLMEFSFNQILDEEFFEKDFAERYPDFEEREVSQ